MKIKKNSFSILLPLETVSRELDYKLFLSIYLAKKGFKVYLGRKKEIWKLFDLHKDNFAYLDKGFHENISEDNIYKIVKNNGGALFHLDEEGGIDFEDSRTIERRYSKEVFDYCDKIFLWGLSQKNFLTKKKPYFLDSKTVISGHPRFQMVSTILKDIYNERSLIIKKKYGKFILFNSNTKYANHIHGEGFLYKNYGPRINNLSERIEYDKIKLENNIKLFHAIVNKTNFNIVIRPHPEEDINYYHELFQNSRIHCIYDDSVIPWIMSSVYTMHNDCTTAVESRLLGKKPISFITDYNKNLSPYLPIKISEAFSNLDEIINYISLDNNLSFGIPNIMKDIFSTELNSTEIIADEIYNFVQENYKKNFPSVLGVKYEITSLLHKFLSYPSYKNNRLAKNKLSEIGNEKFMKVKLDSFLDYLSIHEKASFQSIRPGLYRISF